MSLLVAGIIYFFNTLSRDQIDIYSTTFANVFLFLIIIGFIVAGFRKRINVYDSFVEGAKEGFSTAVRIIPYLVAILVGIGVFRASGAMDYLIDGIGNAVKLCGIDSDFVGALPTALMKPLSGSGARGLMVDAMTTYGPDSFVGRLSCIFQGSTGHHLLYSGGIFRQRRNSEDTPRRSLRTASRCGRGHCSYSYLLSFLRLKYFPYLCTL